MDNELVESLIKRAGPDDIGAAKVNEIIENLKAGDRHRTECEQNRVLQERRAELFKRANNTPDWRRRW